MFQFPEFAFFGLWIQPENDDPFESPGFPIRTSTDQGLFGSSPWLFAAYYVLHR
jgi:hypothetical protein